VFALVFVALGCCCFFFQKMSRYFKIAPETYPLIAVMALGVSLPVLAGFRTFALHNDVAIKKSSTGAYFREPSPLLVAHDTALQHQDRIYEETTGRRVE
jgi:NADH-ubiquinone reductase complex 1 MLRQ subunit